jgi:hypothetical protein
VRELLRQVAVVGDDQQSFAVFIQPPHGEQPRLIGIEQVDHPRPSFRIAVRREYAGRLVEDVILLPFHAERFGVECDLLLLRIDPGAQLGDHLPINRDAPGDDELFARAPRTKPARSEISLQADQVKLRFRFGHGCNEEGRSGCA